MKASEIKAKEKEKTEKMKELRRELEIELEEQLARETETEQPAVEVQKLDMAEINDPERAKQVIEALLFASSKPMSVSELRKVLRGLAPKQIEGFVTEIKEQYEQSKRSFQIVEIAGGYEIVTRKEFAPWIFKVELQKKARQATQSALETLAILAYKQPITRAEIEDLRGVDVSGVMTTLMERTLIKIVGRKEVPGRPFLYGTTDKFLEHFGLKSLQDLPSIEEIKKIVETSVRKEDLMGQQKLVDVDQSPVEGEAAKPSVVDASLEEVHAAREEAEDIILPDVPKLVMPDDSPEFLAQLEKKDVPAAEGEVSGS
ncbi:MAG: SMC-Scp complex subunit ScpB [Candidatus Omnitrophica bacterium]|nr:SMC-Scp complex subunit ScpB [Candidatus Omnitrophota bacterium]